MSQVPAPFAQEINGYRVIDHLGEGGQGKVVRVADPNIPNKQWALKLFRDPLLFEAEKRALGALSELHHRSIPRLADAFPWKQNYALVITYFPGRTAKGVRQEWRWVLKVLRNVGEVLNRIHAHGYLYLDLKPENLILGQDGHQYLVDYSIAQPASGAKAQGIGTAGFTAPEQISRGAFLGPSADAFALGALGYYFLTGAEPIPHQLPSLDSIPRGFEHILRSLLELSPEKRAPISALLSYSLEQAEREMQECPTCGKGLRSAISVCPNCRTRLREASRAVPDLQNRPRVLPKTLFNKPTAASNDVLSELVKPQKKRFPFYRDLRLQAEAIAQIRGFEELRAPTQLKHLITFYEHQLDTAKRALREMRGNAILADEVGLGKTIEAGLITKELLVRTLVKRVLVLVPPHLVDQWAEEMRDKFDMEFDVYHSPDDWGRPLLVASAIAFRRRANFDRIQRLEYPYELVVVDEMHNLLKKDGSPNNVYNNLKDLPRRYTLLLSATPIRRHLRELYHLVNLISPGSFPSLADFLRRYEWLGRRADLKNELARVMIRHHRSNLPAGALPPRRRIEERQVVPTAEEQALLEKAESFLRSRGQASAQSLSQAFSSPASQAALLGMPTPELPCNKLAEALEILRAVRDQTIIFTRDTSTGKYLARELQRAGLPVVFFGPGLSRQDKAHRFYEFKRTKQAVLVATDAAAEGRNLQFAQHLINFDIPWNPLRLEQRMGRIDRLGQTRHPMIYNLYYAASFEAEVYKLFDRGLRMFELIIGELASVLDEIEEFADRSLDQVIASMWSSHAQDPIGLQRAIGQLAAKLHRARDEFDDEKREAAQIEDLF